MERAILRSELTKGAGMRREGETTIRHALIGYEAECRRLIGDVAQAASVEHASPIFDALVELQGDLSTLAFQDGFAIGPGLDALVRSFDRLDDPGERAFWFARFHAGNTWPHETA